MIGFRFHTCGNNTCRRVWLAPVELSASTPNISGEATAYCPACHQRAAMSEPVINALSFNHIQRAMRASGSHWWDASTMQFHWCKPLGAVLTTDDGAYAFFVATYRTFDDQTAFKVYRYVIAENHISDPDGFDNLFETEGAALEQSAALAGAGFRRNSEPHKPVSDLDDLRRTIADHTGAEPSKADTRRLIELATRYHRSAEALCNGDIQRMPAATAKAINALAVSMGCKAQLGGDPRGCVVKLIMPDGYTNDFGGEGVCVPIN